MHESGPQATQRDIARKLGISNAAVSLAAESLFYQKQLSKHSANHASVAWLNLWPEQEDRGGEKCRFFDEYRRGAELCTAKFGYRIEDFSLNNSSAPRIEEILLARGISAIILSPRHFHHEMDLRGFHWEKFSAIRSDRFPLDPALHLVTPDQFGNTILAFEQILSRGYKRIGFINSGKTDEERIWRSECGYLSVQQELPPGERLPVYRLDDSDAASREGLRRWMKNQRPDAIITLHSNAREVLESIGYRCPEDIALASVNSVDCDIDAGIDPNAAEIGRSAVLQLLSMIHDNERGIPRHPREIVIKGRWVEGTTLPGESKKTNYNKNRS
jgi:LacI family transcriptional regulator